MILEYHYYTGRYKMFDDILFQFQQHQEFTETAIRNHQQMVEEHQMANANSIDQFMDAYRIHDDAEAARIHAEAVKAKAERAEAEAEYEKFHAEIEARAEKRRAEIKKAAAEMQAAYEKKVAEMKAAYKKRVAEMQREHENSDIVRMVEAHFASTEK